LLVDSGRPGVLLLHYLSGFLLLVFFWLELWSRNRGYPRLLLFLNWLIINVQENSFFEFLFFLLAVRNTRLLGHRDSRVVLSGV
jgi:hypothetical protein